MTKNSILSEIYQSKDLDVMIRSIKPQHLQDDIRQYCFLELLEKSEEFVLDLYNRGKLKGYIMRVIYNTSKGNKHNGLKIQLGNETPTEVIPECICEQYEEINIEPVLKDVYWYKTELLRLYAEHGTFKKVSDLTKIPLKSVYTTIVEARKEIKKKYYESGKH